MVRQAAYPRSLGQAYASRKINVIPILFIDLRVNIPLSSMANVLFIRCCFAGVTLTAYSSDRIFCERTDEHTDRLVWYKEPTPEAVGPLSSIVSGAAPIYKVIFMAPQPRLDEIRPVIEQAMLGRASLTTALSGMLEVRG